MAAAQNMMFPSSPSDLGMGGGSSGPDSDAEKEARRQRMKAEEFKLHRKAHYDEFEAIRRWKEEHKSDDDEDDDDNGMEL